MITLGTVHLIFRGGGGVRAENFFSDKIGARLFFSPALRAMGKIIFFNQNQSKEFFFEKKNSSPPPPEYQMDRA